MCETLLEFAKLTATDIEDLISAGLVTETPFHKLLLNLRIEYNLGDQMIKLRLIKRYFAEHLNLFDAYRLTSEGLELSALTADNQANNTYITYVDDILRGCGLFYEPCGDSENENEIYYNPRTKSKGY
jgi:hypothetical protein